MKTTFFCKMTAVLALSFMTSHAAEELPMRVTEVAAFKNGYSQVSLKGDITRQDTQLLLRGMPVPLLGSFWWQAPQGVSVRDIKSATTVRQVRKPRFSTVEFLLANPGEQAKIVLTNGAELTGTICETPSAAADSSFLRYTELQDPQKSYRPNRSTVYAEPESQMPPSAHSVVQLLTPRGITTLRQDHILYAEVLTVSPNYPTTERQVPSLTLELSNPAQGKALHACCLCSGLSWLPSYRLDLSDDGQARFQCKAMVMNELANLEHVKLELVMGYPALGKYLLPSPMSMQHSLCDFLNLISEDDRQKYDTISSNIASNNNSGYVAEQQPEPGSLTQAEDLFFYTIPDFTCAVGQTVTQELFEGEVPYSHVYTWNVPTQSDIEDWQRGRNRSYNNTPAPNEVWHCVRVHNNLRAPWTAGVLDCYAAGRLVGRTEIHFTAEGASTLVRLNKTMQAPVQYTERLVSKETDSLTLEGELTFTNHSDKEMRVIITKEVEGTPLSAGDNATITCTPDYGRNPDGRFRWEITVQPGESKTVSYRYSYKN